MGDPSLVDERRSDRAFRSSLRRWIVALTIAGFAIRGAVALVADGLYPSALGLVLIGLGWLWLSD